MLSRKNQPDQIFLYFPVKNQPNQIFLYFPEKNNLLSPLEKKWLLDPPNFLYYF